MAMTLTHRIAHFTDTHIPDEGLLYGAIDSFGQLQRGLAAAAESDPPVSALLFTGDLADLGQPAAYARMRSAIDPVAERLGVPAIFGIGNHDDHAAFREGLLGGEPTGDPVDYVTAVDGVRIVMLDSTSSGHHGEVTPEQLDWLRGVLAEPAPRGTVLTLHHPPLNWPDIASPLNGDHTRAEAAGIGDPSPLADVVRGTDVRVVLSGHLHDIRSGVLGGVPVWAGASMANALQMGETFHALAASRMSFVDLYDDGTVVTSTLDLAPPPVAKEMTYRELIAHYSVH